MYFPVNHRKSDPKCKNRDIPNREELSFLVVLAFPMASIMGLLANTLFSIFEESVPAIEAKYLIANLAETVFPEILLN